jgi:hypothetical protein
MLFRKSIFVSHNVSIVVCWSTIQPRHPVRIDRETLIIRLKYFVVLLSAADHIPKTDPQFPSSCTNRQERKKVCILYKILLLRVCGDDYKTGIGLTTGFIGSHTITVYTIYNLQQLSLFSSSEDCCSNSATTAATNSYGIPCHYSLTAAAPLSNTKLLPH